MVVPTMVDFRARSKARRYLVQALYQHHLSGAEAGVIQDEFTQAPEPLRGADAAYFKTLLHDVIARQAELNQHLAPCLDRPLDALDAVELSVLQLGVYELCHRQEVPWKVVIDEAVKLTQMFGAEQSYGYINAVLERLAHSLRPGEIESGNGCHAK